MRSPVGPFKALMLLILAVQLWYISSWKSITSSVSITPATLLDSPIHNAGVNTGTCPPTHEDDQIIHTETDAPNSTIRLTTNHSTLKATSSLNMTHPSTTSKPDLNTNTIPWLCSHEVRQQAVRKACTELNMLNWGSKSVQLKHKQFFVDEKHQLAFCAIPEAASTTWIQYLAFATGRIKSFNESPMRFSHKLSSMGIRQLSSYNESDIHRILETFTKFMVVRHPLSRLFSAWRDKLYRPDSTYYRRTLGKKILSRYRGNYSDSDTVNFHEFAQYVASGGRDDHWMTFQKCMPCTIKYDYILRTETSDFDAQPIMDQLAVSVPVPRIHANELNHTKTASVLNDYSGLPADTINSLMRFYYLDMKIFGYQFTPESLVGECSVDRDDNLSCC